MNIAIVGGTPLAAAIAARLASSSSVNVFGDRARPGTTVVASLAQLARVADVVILALDSGAEVQEALFSAEGLLVGLSAGKTVIDQTPGDPEATRANAAELRQRGIDLIDAPLHCELLDALPETAAIMCGGPESVATALRPLLETICPKVVYFGETGSGQAARLVIGAIAACNRLVTYEASAMGYRNGLSVDDMAAVLNRCSGASSATARVLPALAAGGRTADSSLASVVEELRLASLLGTRLGAPMIVANLVHGLLMAAASGLAASATLDDTARVFLPGLGAAASTDGVRVAAL